MTESIPDLILRLKELGSKATPAEPYNLEDWRDQSESCVYVQGAKGTVASFTTMEDAQLFTEMRNALSTLLDAVRIFEEMSSYHSYQLGKCVEVLKLLTWDHRNGVSHGGHFDKASDLLEDLGEK